MIGIDSDRLILPPDLKSNINGRHTLDEELLGAYRSEIGHGGSSRFIGLHIMGSHWEYYPRYPKTFRKFGNTSELAQVSMGSVLMDDPKVGTVLVDVYDNSLLYMDWILQQIIETACTLRCQPASRSSLTTGRTCSYRRAWPITAAGLFSERIRGTGIRVGQQRLSRQAFGYRGALQANAGKDIRSHNFFQTLDWIMEIWWPQFDPHRSFPSGEFVTDSHSPYMGGGVLLSE